MVCARSAKIGPDDVLVGTGTPACSRKVVPLLVALSGRFPILAPMALPRNRIRLPFAVTAEGTKWLPCAWMEAGLSGSAVPARKSGSSPGPKMNSPVIRSRRF